MACYCSEIKPFDPQITFAILIHKLEVNRGVATGRMAHLFLCGSHLILGGDYSDDSLVNRLIEDTENRCVVLYPGVLSENLTLMSRREKSQQFPCNKKTVVFVIDGTWATARKTMRLSENLRTLPRVAFDPPGPSRFKIRKQPHVHCLSTIEAIHHTIELLGESRGFYTASRRHDQMLRVFQNMIEFQMKHIPDSFRKYYSAAG